MKDTKSEMIEKIRKVFEEYGYTLDNYAKAVVGVEYFTKFGRRFDIVESREKIIFHLIKRGINEY